MENYSSWSLIVAGILVFFCVLPIIIFGALAFFGVKWFDKFVTPNPIALKQKLNQRRQSNPNLTDDDLIGRIITEESLKAGIVGALTGLGGLPLLPIAVPVDFALSAKIQFELIHFIAYVYAPYESEADMKLKTVAIMAGGEGMKAANKAIQETIRRLVISLVGRAAAKSVLKVMPVVGAVVGFGFNWFATRSVGLLATKWYKNELQSPSMQTVKEQVSRVRNTTVGIGRQVAGGASEVVRKASPGINSGAKKLGAGLKKGIDVIGSNLAKPVDMSNSLVERQDNRVTEEIVSIDPPQLIPSSLQNTPSSPAEEQSPGTDGAATRPNPDQPAA